MQGVINAKRRNARATAEQKDALLNFMELNKALAQNKITGPERNRLWAKLTARLNCLGGSNKNEQQWMKFWNDLKGYTRAKARDALKVRNRTGEAGPSGLNTPPPVLNATDEKIMALIGIDMADGDGVTRELGMGHTATLKRKRSPTRPSSSSPANFYVSNDNSFQEEVDTGSISGISSDINTNQNNTSPPLSWHSLVIDENPRIAAESVPKRRKNETKKSIVEAIREQEEKKINVLNEINSSLININNNLSIIANAVQVYFNK